MKNMPVLEPTCVSLKLHNCLWKINLSLNWYVYPWGDVCPLRAAGEEISSNEWLYVSCTLSCSSVCVVIRLRPGLRRDGVLITERCKRFLLFWGTHSFLFSECRRVENCALLGYYTTSHHNFLLTFQDKVSVQSLGCRNPKESLLSQHRVYYREEYGQWKVSITWWQPIGLMQVVGREGVW